MPFSNGNGRKQMLIILVFAELALIGLLALGLGAWVNSSTARTDREVAARAAAEERSDNARHTELVRSCRRGNELRIEISEDREALRGTLLFTARAIEQRVARSNTTGSERKRALELADHYRDLAGGLREVRLIDCEQAFPAQ